MISLLPPKYTQHTPTPVWSQPHSPAQPGLVTPNTALVNQEPPKASSALAAVQKRGLGPEVKTPTVCRQGGGKAVPPSGWEAEDSF